MGGKAQIRWAVCKELHLDMTRIVSKNFPAPRSELSVMRRLSLIAMIGLCVSLAQADSIPVYRMNSGSVVLSDINIGTFGTLFSFSNGNGINIGGTDSWSSCLTFAPGGSSCNPDLVMGFNESSGNVNGASMFLFGAVTIAGSSFALPTSGTAFSITAPFYFPDHLSPAWEDLGPSAGVIRVHPLSRSSTLTARVR
jgi:hypothetical protein